jgi:trimeric autotransporter adhesin
MIKAMRTFLFTVLVLLLYIPVFAQPSQKNDSFSRLLNADGTINQRLLQNGSFNTTGYSISYQENGEPVFNRPGRNTVAGDENWAPDFAIPGTNGLINTVHIDNNDVYVGGIFSKAGGINANNIAKWNGNVWTAMGTGIGGTTVQVTGIKKFGNFVYATSTIGVFRWDGNSWTQIGTLTQSLYSSLSAAALDVDANGNLYVTGDFVNINGIAVNGIAKWNGSSWSALGTGIDNPGGGFGVSLAVQGNNVYLGGGFTRVGGVLATNIAIWNGSNWNRLGTGITTTGGVTCLAVSGTDLYVGAPGMTAAGSVPVNNIAKWNGTNWSALGNGLNNGPNALCVLGNDLYAGGQFTQSGALPLNKIAKWDGTAWSDAGNGLYMSSGVLALAINPQHFFAGGSSWSGDPLNLNHLARWNGSKWVSVGNGMNDYVNCVTVSGNYVYIGGKFTEAGGLKTYGIARWDGQKWDSLGSGFSSGEVFDIEVMGNLVYAGGSIAWGGPSGPSYLGVWNGNTWSAVGTGVNSSVFTLEARGTDLYVGGTFSTAGGITVNNIAKWNGSAWSALGFGSNGIVKDIKFTSDGTMYAGGNFTTIGSVAANRIAKWNGSSWSAVGSGVNSFVNTIGISSTDEIYIGGSFDLAYNVGVVNYIAKWNGSAWQSVDGGMGPVSGSVYSIVFHGSDMYVGGVFSMAGTTAASSIAKWNGTAWSALGSGASGDPGQSIVSDLGIQCNSLFAAGFFTRAGDKRSDRFARYWLDGLPAVTISTANTTVCSGTNINFTATPQNGGASPSYQWLVNGANVGTNAATYSTNSLSNASTVQVIMSGNAGCIHPVNASSNIISMTVQPLLTPTVTISTPFNTICAGTNAAFIANPVNAGSNPSYQWQVNGSNAGTNSNTFSSSSLTNNAQVQVIITTAGGGCYTSPTASSNTITMTVNPAVTPSISITGTTTINPGVPSIITSTILNGGSAPTYTWSDSTSTHSWQLIPSAGNASLSYTALASGDKLRATLTSNAACAAPLAVNSNDLRFTVTTVTAVGNVNAREFGIYYYPNPAKNILIIDSLKMSDQWLTATITSADGQKMMKEEYLNNRSVVTLNISRLPAGTYMLILRRKTGKNAFFKFIKS